jgi:LPS-assembly lipoprotein
MLRRRALLVLGTAGALSGCGFQPVYMPTASGQPGVAQRDLAAVFVDIIPDRPGQELRQALQERFERAGGASGQLYELTVQYWISGEGIAVQPDNSVTRIRAIGNANWVLVAKDPARTRLTNGSARSFDAYNILDEQYFAADLENQALQKRVAEAIADQITLQLATYFHKRAAASASL